MLASLTPREERVLRMRFGIGMNTDHTLEEVGQQFCVTRERIRQIEAKALRKLKHPSRSRASCAASSTIERRGGRCFFQRGFAPIQCSDRVLDYSRRKKYVYNCLRRVNMAGVQCTNCTRGTLDMKRTVVAALGVALIASLAASSDAEAAIIGFSFGAFDGS